jgi:hypothetical protein
VAKNKIKAAQAVGAFSIPARRKRRPSFRESKRNSRLALRLTNLHKREEHIKGVLRLKSWASMSSITEYSAAEQAAASSGGDSTFSTETNGKNSLRKPTFTHQDGVAQARRIAEKATERFNKKIG